MLLDVLKPALIELPGLIHGHLQFLKLCFMGPPQLLQLVAMSLISFLEHLVHSADLLSKPLIFSGHLVHLLTESPDFSLELSDRCLALDQLLFVFFSHFAQQVITSLLILGSLLLHLNHKIIIKL